MFIGYTNANIKCAEGDWRLKVVAVVAWMFGVLIHANGIPFGRNRAGGYNRGATSTSGTVDGTHQGINIGSAVLHNFPPQ